MDDLSDHDDLIPEPAPEPPEASPAAELAPPADAPDYPQPARPLARMDEADEDDPEEAGGPRMSLGEHLEELRRRLIWAIVGLAVAMGVTLWWGNWLLTFLRKPFDDIMRSLHKDPDFITQTLVEPVSIYFQVCLVAGLVLAAPWICWQLWKFVAAGLYKRERRYVYFSVPFSAALFVTGALFFMFVMAEPMYRFLIWFADQINVRMMLRLDDYIDFVTWTMVVFGLCFQLPLAVLVLAKVGLVSVKSLNKYRRHVVVAVLVVAAIVTPSPSPLDQLMLAIPMQLLYELGVLLAWLLVERKARREEIAAG
ncbi:MAG: twin-arginine translocase subunit TatC [Planctomycetaceae bacterium]|nr:twin-arginine translocase subunit TatC [Planctomycetaceae bacterium]